MNAQSSRFFHVGPRLISDTAGCGAGKSSLHRSASSVHIMRAVACSSCRDRSSAAVVLIQASDRLTIVSNLEACYLGISSAHSGTRPFP